MKKICLGARKIFMTFFPFRQKEIVLRLYNATHYSSLIKCATSCTNIEYYYSLHELVVCVSVKLNESYIYVYYHYYTRKRYRVQHNSIKHNTRIMLEATLHKCTIICTYGYLHDWWYGHDFSTAVWLIFTMQTNYLIPPKRFKRGMNDFRFSDDDRVWIFFRLDTAEEIAMYTGNSENVSSLCGERA